MILNPTEKILVFERVHGRPKEVLSKDFDSVNYVTSVFEVETPDKAMMTAELLKLEDEILDLRNDNRYYRTFIKPYRDLLQRFYSIVEGAQMDHKMKKKAEAKRAIMPRKRGR